jgi:3-oxoadipate enol-lactonase
MDTRLRLSDGCELQCRIVDYTDPWREAETLVCVHGLGESMEVWRGWIPYFARDYRVVCVDVRGFGNSTPMTKDFQWSMDVILRDFDEALAQLGGKPVHMAGAKSGGTMVMKYAAERPDMVKSLISCGGPIIGTQTKPWLDHIESKGVRDWAASSMGGRFGTMLGPEAIAWWVDLTSKTPVSTFQSYLKWVPSIDISKDVSRIECPMLFIAPTDGKLRPVEETTAWLKQVKRHELKTIECDGWHVLGARPDECAKLGQAFLAKLRSA